MYKKILIGLVLAVGGTGVAAFVLANREVKAQVDNLLDQAVANGVYEEASYESIDVGLDGQVTLHNLQLKDTIEMEEGPGYELEYIFQQVVLSDYDFTHEIPHHVSIKASGLTFPGGMPGLEAPEPNLMTRYLESRLQEDTLPVVMDYRYDYQPEDDNRFDNHVTLSLADGLTASFSSTVKKLPLEAVLATDETSGQMNQMRALTYLTTAEIPHASLTIADHGMVDALVGLYASERNMDSARLRQQLAAQMASLYLFAPASLQDFALQLSEQLSKFLQGQQTLHISLAPEQGGSIQQLQGRVLTAFFTQNYADIVELLNLEVVTQTLDQAIDTPSGR